MTVKSQRNENILRRQVFPIPANVAPTKTRCVQVHIPDDDEHMAVFLGALDLLTKWNSWQRDGTNNAVLASHAWRDAIYNNPIFELCDSGAKNQGFAGADGGDEELIRQNPDNPCELQSSVNGTDWCTFADLSLCLNSGQPGAGAKQPEPNGGTACYTGKLQANGTVLLPTIVNTGDVITVNKLTGAGTDGSLHWYCPGGDIFFAGTCGGGASLDGSDPLPTAYHMSIIVNINGTYYPLAQDGTITVGASVSNQQAILQVNDASLGDNSGEYTFDICVQNNQGSDWTHTFNFALSTSGFVFNTANVTSGTPGIWTPGAGYEDTVAYQGVADEYFRTIRIKRTGIAPFSFKSASVTFDLTKGGFVGSGEYGLHVEAVSSGTSHDVITQGNSSMSNGAGQVESGSLSVSNVDELRVTLTCSSSVGSDTTSGSDALFTLTIAGQGVEPTW